MKNLLKLFLFSMCIFVESPIRLPSREMQLQEISCRIKVEEQVRESVKVKSKTNGQSIDIAANTTTDKQLKEYMVADEMKKLKKMQQRMEWFESLSDEDLASQWANYKIGMSALKENGTLILIKRGGECGNRQYISRADFQAEISTPEKIELFEIVFGKGSYDLNKLIFKSTSAGFAWENGKGEATSPCIESAVFDFK